MKIMNKEANEQKARELSNKYERIVEYSVEQCLIEMAEWKDKQFLQLLEELPQKNHAIYSLIDKLKIKYTAIEV